jgi:transposase
VDETSLTLHPPLRACWTKRGVQKRVNAPGQPQAHHFFAAYDWCKDEVTALPAERKDSESFIVFLEHLLVHRYPDEVVVLVMDNASIHKSGPSLATLSLFEHRLAIVWLPAYCSTLNPIERYFRHLKDQVAINTLHPDLAALVSAVQRELVAQNNPVHPDRFTFLKDIP